jgi:hypothetical protein
VTQFAAAPQAFLRNLTKASHVLALTALSTDAFIYDIENCCVPYRKIAFVSLSQVQAY